MGSDIYLEFIVFITPSIALLARSNLISIDESINIHGLYFYFYKELDFRFVVLKFQYYPKAALGLQLF